MIEINQSGGFADTLLGGLVGFVFAILSFFIFEFFNRRKEEKKEAERLEGIKRIIVRNLIEIRKRTDTVKNNYAEVIKKINDPTHRAIMYSVHGFNTGIYGSHHLIDYAQIFSKNDSYVLLIEVYEIVQEISERSPEKLLSNYKQDYERLRQTYPNGFDNTMPQQFIPFQEAWKGLTERDTKYLKGMLRNIDLLAVEIEKFLNSNNDQNH